MYFLTTPKKFGDKVIFITFIKEVWWQSYVIAFIYIRNLVTKLYSWHSHTYNFFVDGYFLFKYFQKKFANYSFLNKTWFYLYFYPPPILFPYYSNGSEILNAQKKVKPTKSINGAERKCFLGGVFHVEITCPTRKLQSGVVPSKN